MSKSSSRFSATCHHSLLQDVVSAETSCLTSLTNTPNLKAHGLAHPPTTLLLLTTGFWSTKWAEQDLPHRARTYGLVQMAALRTSQSGAHEAAAAHPAVDDKPIMHVGGFQCLCHRELFPWWTGSFPLSSCLSLVHKHQCLTLSLADWLVRKTGFFLVAHGQGRGPGGFLNRQRGGPWPEGAEMMVVAAGGVGGSKEEAANLGNCVPLIAT